ncbi:MAG: enhanced serine sensitivity protein SseB C-terminal domain-containing protein [Solobacterium sp.]|nr:enhanced serine sensitivity protein SseB C-terminal domain-containing protein [Solobacterium sp.]
MAKKPVNRKMATIRQIEAKDVKNDSLKEAMDHLRETRTRDNEIRMFEELQKARFLVPVQFSGEQPNLQLRFVMINTPDKKSYFPAFTDETEANKMNLPEGENRQYIVRTLKEFEPIFKDTRGQSAGVVVNPFSNNILLPRDLISKLNTLKAGAVGDNPVNVKKGEIPAGAVVKFEEPRIYPTALVNAVYDVCGTIPEVSRVWFKQMMIGMNVNFALIVEADKFTSELEEKLRITAEPLSKNIPIQVLKYTDQLEKQAVNGAIALYDRELNI